MMRSQHLKRWHLIFYNWIRSWILGVSNPLSMSSLLFKDSSWHLKYFTSILLECTTNLQFSRRARWRILALRHFVSGWILILYHFLFVFKIVTFHFWYFDMLFKFENIYFNFFVYLYFRMRKSCRIEGGTFFVFVFLDHLFLFSSVLLFRL